MIKSKHKLNSQFIVSCRLTLFLLFVAAVFVVSVVTGHIQFNSSERELLPVYLIKRNQAARRYHTPLLVQNSTGESAGAAEWIQMMSKG